MGSHHSSIRKPLKETPSSRRTIMPIESRFEASPWSEDVMPVEGHFEASPGSEDVTSHLPLAIHKCPVEILTEIFMHYLEDKECQIQHLLLVCGHWYRMIIVTPLFWTKITLSIFSPVRPTAASQLHYLKACLQRSRDMLLDIELRCERRSFSTNKWTSYGPVIDLLSESIYRTKTLHVTLPSNFALSEVVCTLFKGAAPNMVRLSVDNFRYRSDQRISFSELPSVRILQIDIYAFMEMVHLYHSLPLAGLLSLDVELYGFTIWVSRKKLGNWMTDISLLRSLRSLQLRYTGSGRIHPNGFTQTPISLPLLQNLGLWGMEQVELKLELPALRTLTFDGAHFPKTAPIELIWRPDGVIPTVDRRIIKDMILQYRSTELFVLPEWTQEYLIYALQMMRIEGNVLDSSVSFMKESKDGTRSPMNITQSRFSYSQVMYNNHR